MNVRHRFFCLIMVLCCLSGNHTEAAKPSWPRLLLGAAAGGALGWGVAKLFLWWVKSPKKPPRGPCVDQTTVDVQTVGPFIDRIAQYAPATVLQNFQEFCPREIMASPAPSLRRVRTFKFKYTQVPDRHRTYPWHLIAVDNSGNLVLSNTRFSRSGVAYRANRQEDAPTFITLDDGWTLQGSYQCDGAIPVRKSYPNGTRVKLGRFDIETRRITELADVEETGFTEIWAMNHHAAIIKIPGDDYFYWVRGPAKKLITGTSGLLGIKMTIDTASDRVIWTTGEKRSTYYVQDFSNNAHPNCTEYRCKGNNDIAQRKNVVVRKCLHNIYCDVLQAGRWIPMLCYTRNDDESSLIAINHACTVVFCNTVRTASYPDSAASCRASAYPMGIILQTGVAFFDDPSYFDTHSDEIKNIVVSQNGRWIAAKWYKGEIWLWHVQGVDIIQNCSWENRIYLDEFRKLYDTAKKLHAYVHLSQELWNKFQELRMNPKNETPVAWNVRFKPPRHRTGA